jgi:hypothetical protein
MKCIKGSLKKNVSFVIQAQILSLNPPRIFTYCWTHLHLLRDTFSSQAANHYGCLGEVPLNLQKECTELRNQATALLSKVFNQPVFRYEHGRAGHCIAKGIASRSCHHYHEHLLPADISLHALMEKRFQGIAISSGEDVCALFERYDEYLLVAESNGDHRFYVANSDDVEPHLLRTLTAAALGYPERANWESYSSCEMLLTGKKVIDNQMKQICAA